MHLGLTAVVDCRLLIKGPLCKISNGPFDMKCD